MTVLEKCEHKLKALLQGAAEATYPDTNIPEFLIEVPKDETNGDYSTNLAMIMARLVHRAPKEIAENIAGNIKKDEMILKVDVAGAGFINFYLDSGYIYKALEEIERMGENYGFTDVGRGKKICVEFVSANPTGPMHMGNARGGAIGDCLAAILKKAGYEVSREFYVNDAGAQIDKFGRSLDARYRQILGEEIEFPEDGYQGDDIREHSQNFIDEFGDKLKGLDEEARRQELIKYALPKNLKRMKSDLEAYRIKYDTWFMESSLHDAGEVMETVEILKKTDVVYEKEGAIWFKSTNFIEKKGDNDRSYKDDVLVRANGVPTYFAADIAYHRNKLLTRGADIAINVWGADHHGHIARMKGALKALGVDPDRLHVITMQLVRLMENGEVVRMSKRTGKMIALSDLIEDIGIDAARFFFNLRQAGSHFDFDLGLAVEQSNDNPVFYVQYAHARICSILRLLEEEGFKPLPYSEINSSFLVAKEEISLMKKLADMPEEIRVAAETYEPSRITRYVMEVAAAFHSFYNSCRIKGEEEELVKARLKLCDAARIVIKNCLSILGVTAPEKM